MGSDKLAAAVSATGAAVAASFVWFPYRALLVTGAVIAGLGALALLAVLRRGPAWRVQERLIRRLWRMTRRIPYDQVVLDPATGRRFSTGHRQGFLCFRRGFLTLDVTGPDGADSDVTLTRYVVGFIGQPLTPPLFRYQEPLRGTRRPMSWRQANALLRFNDAIGAMEADQAEIAEVCAQLGRAIATAAHQL
jgi:hypothetical protein